MTARAIFIERAREWLRTLTKQERADVKRGELWRRFTLSEEEARILMQEDALATARDADQVQRQGFLFGAAA